MHQLLFQYLIIFDFVSQLYLFVFILFLPFNLLHVISMSLCSQFPSFGFKALPDLGFEVKRSRYCSLAKHKLRGYISLHRKGVPRQWDFPIGFWAILQKEISVANTHSWYVTGFVQQHNLHILKLLCDKKPTIGYKRTTSRLSRGRACVGARTSDIP